MLLLLLMLIPYGSYGNQQSDGKPLSKMTISERCVYYHNMMLISAKDDDRKYFNSLKIEFEKWVYSLEDRYLVQWAMEEWVSRHPTVFEVLMKWSKGSKVNSLEWWAAEESDVIIRELDDFEEEKNKRESVAIQRLKDIRDLQNAYKDANGRYVSTIDSLQRFYREGFIPMLTQFGSIYDSVAIANTAALCKAKFPQLKGEELNRQLYECYLEGNRSLVFTITKQVPVRETLFIDRPDFNIDSLAFIPYSGGRLIQMDATIRAVQGVRVPVFEASIPYRLLFKGMNTEYVELRIKWKNDAGHYPGLKIGDINSLNHNAGSWE